VLSATEQAVRIHFDVVERTPQQTELLLRLRRYDLAARSADESTPMIQWLRQTGAPSALASEAAAKPWIRRAFMRSAAKSGADEAVTALEQLLADPAVQQLRAYLVARMADIDRPRTIDEVWEDYEQNAAQLLGVLDEVAEGGSEAANRGHLPAEIAERVQALTLDLAFLKASLRGYQAFGAKYALVQQRTILGDEMGLGKTVEALAAICHLRANGQATALVVCPASVVANWRSEIHRHTKLTAHVIHGQERDRSRRNWEQKGGIGITTFDGLRRLGPPRSAQSDGTLPPLAMLVVDEAHYVKNPETLRSKAVAQWTSQAHRVLFLTGTPMENRVEEFRALIEHLQPEVAQRVSATTALAGAAAFQTAVAPAYLRRNQTDVLDELPELIPSLDWVDPTDADLRTYLDAVRAQAFQSMRRAAYRSIPVGGPTEASEVAQSAKLGRLVDIIEEANEEGLKVVVFSYFRDVLDIVTRAAQIALPGAVYGPLTGSTAVHDRQRLIDALSAHPGGAVLTSQIEAGGVGVNIQAASVVVLCEPQWKPTIEQQAIARCHRMGQVRRVQVHRLLLEETVDQRMLAVLAGKQHLIEQFVSGSAVKDASPDSVDISDLERVERVVNETQAEALILASEQRRLGLTGSPASTV
jgi:SNF2 family DNA or RNA helicase